MIPFAKCVKILKQDANGLLALYKPTSVLSHPNHDSSSNNGTTHNTSLIKGPYDYHGEFYSVPSAAIEGKEQCDVRIWLINRLDMATSGIVLASTSQAVSDAVKEELKMRRVHKIYSALVFNQSAHVAARKNQQPFTWTNDITVNKADNHIRTQGGSGSNYVTAETNVRIRSSQSSNRARDQQNGHCPLMMLDLEPLTGYSHQLRFQAAQHGYPIVGDAMYGDFRDNKKFKVNFQSHQINYLQPEQLDDPSVDINNVVINSKKPPQRNYFNRLFLHARKIELSYELGGIKYNFSVECPMPRVFDVAFKGTRRNR